MSTQRHNLLRKLAAKRFGPLNIIKMIGKNAISIDLPTYLKVHPVVHASHKMPVVKQPDNITHLFQRNRLRYLLLMVVNM